VERYLQAQSFSLPAEELISGRLFGPALFPQSLELVLSAARLGLPIIGAGGVYTMENVEAMITAGALWVQMDAGLWLPKI